ncbi:cell wall elongation regulator TseB-like domain-containing protein [Virgibacillus alimentarius]|uniref:Uncharacterized protein YpmB n=1 Tax=Virgibacillus alimentarius TaxID=698769 RepID=A0ABS4S634_9BACI|nr:MULTISPECIES: DUF5590 domain-containing protein [Virgibacillus]MBP2256354.1 uncharacterized protein YpmB [Virgibacillus alimentarius]HLR66299.1 DUF5590 domain-containing protein [Virgibacillus sp.]
MKNNYMQSNAPSWLKWGFWILCLFLLVGLIYSIYLYHSIQKSKVAGFAETKEKILEETDLVSIDEIERFNGEQAFHILFGKTEEGKNKIVFFPLKKKEKKVKIIDKSKIVPKEKILNQWNSECKDCKMIKIKPAMVKDKPLWELTYIDSTDRYALDYLSIYDGSHYEQYRFKKMF